MNSWYLVEQQIIKEDSLINIFLIKKKELNIYIFLFINISKGNKYIFKTEYTNFANTNGEYEEVFNKEVRYCYDMNYNDYYFINNEAEIGGDDFLEDILNFDSINSYSIVSKHDAYSYKLIKSLENFKKDKNKLEILSIEDLDLSFADSILKNLKSLSIGLLSNSKIILIVPIWK